MNLVDLIKNYASPDLISSASSFLGESQNTTAKGIELAIPTILNGLLNTSYNTSQMGQIWDLINHKENKSNLLSELSALFGGDPQLIGSDSLGSQMLKVLFGSNSNNITSEISKLSGLNNNESAVKIFSIVSTLILSFLKKKVKTEGYGASGLSAWIGGQKNDIMKSIPAEISSVLNIVSHKKMNSTNSNAEVEVSTTNWIPWLIAIFALLGLMWFVMKSCNMQKPEEVNSKTSIIEIEKAKLAQAFEDSIKNISIQSMKMYEGLDSNIRAKWMTLGNLVVLNLPNGMNLNIPKNGVENKLIHWLMDSTQKVDKTTWFDFDRILFETGSSVIHPASKDQISNIAITLKAFPNVKIKLGGYTDNVGKISANLKLSDERAKAVMTALMSMGIDATRLAAEGYGSQFPVGDNSTNEGREMNRRISIRVTQK